MKQRLSWTVLTVLIGLPFIYALFNAPIAALIAVLTLMCVSLVGWAIVEVTE